MRDDNTFCSEKSHKKTRKDQLGPRGGFSLIHNSVKDVRADVSEGFLLEFYEEDSSSIVNCSKFPHWIQVEHHEGGYAPHASQKCCSVEAFPLPLSTNASLDSFY